MEWEESFPGVWIAQVGQFSLTVRWEWGFWLADCAASEFHLFLKSPVPGNPSPDDGETAKRNALMLATVALGNAVGATTEAYLELAKVVMEEVESSMKEPLSG